MEKRQIDLRRFINTPHILEKIFLEHLDHAVFENCLNICKSWREALVRAILEDPKYRAKVEKGRLQHYWLKKGEITERIILDPKKQRQVIHAAAKDPVQHSEVGNDFANEETFRQPDQRWRPNTIVMNEKHVVILGCAFVESAFQHSVRIFEFGSSDFEEVEVPVWSRTVPRIHATNNSFFLSTFCHIDEYACTVLEYLSSPDSNGDMKTELKILQLGPQNETFDPASEQPGKSVVSRSFFKEYRAFQTAGAKNHQHELCVDERFLAIEGRGSGRKCEMLYFFDHVTNMLLWRKPLSDRPLEFTFKQVEITDSFVIVSFDTYHYPISDSCCFVSVLCKESGQIVHEIGNPTGFRISVNWIAASRSGKYLAYSSFERCRVTNHFLIYIRNLMTNASSSIQLPYGPVKQFSFVQGHFMFVQMYTSDAKEALEVFLYDIEDPLSNRRIHRSASPNSTIVTTESILGSGCLVASPKPHNYHNYRTTSLDNELKVISVKDMPDLSRVFVLG